MPVGHESTYMSKLTKLFYIVICVILSILIIIGKLVQNAIPRHLPVFSGRNILESIIVLLLAGVIVYLINNKRNKEKPDSIRDT